tara:strand:+ start:101 stop:1267 length:1167 start_codon:yes stop_codon:yes gene_type:complete
MNNKKKIAVITGTRAEYGLLRWVIEGINNSEFLDLKIIVTGMHLSPEFGLTYKQIEDDGFFINKKVECLLSSDTPTGIIKSIGLGMISFSETIEEIKPDLILMLGDRFEMLSAATAAMVSRIPIAHLHGGESTEGLIDEPIRHSITKMSHIHFVATEKYRNRVIQLGESPKRVFNVGGLGIDSIHKIKLLNKIELQKKLNIKLLEKNILVTFHPVTLENNTSEIQMRELLKALSTLKDTFIIFTMPNADTNSRILSDLIKEFCSKNKNAREFQSLGQKNYLSCIKSVDCVVGNSSSGIIEVPSFKVGTINIGDRQRGRIMAASIINCLPTKIEILRAIKKIYSKNFQDRIKDVINPYGSGGASKKIIKKLEKINTDDLLKKKFYDLDT